MFPTRRITTGGGDVFRDEFSLAFDGSNDYINIGNPSALQFGTTSCSFSIWYKQDSGDSGYIISKRDADAGQFSVFVQSDGKHRFYIGTASQETNFGSAASFGAWNHLLIVYEHSGTDSGAVYKYLNGVLDATDTSINNNSNVDDNQAWRINGRFAAGDAMTGSSDVSAMSISEIAIYNKALSASEVKTLYNGREPYNHKEGVCSSNLQAWWRMGDGVLDDRNGLVADQTNATLNSNVVVNGKFDTDSDWTKGTGWSINDGEAIFTGTDFANLTPASSPLESGKNYKITLDATVTNGSFKLQHNSVDIITGNTTGSFTGYFTSSNTTFNIARASVGVQNDFTIDNIVIKKINGKSGIMTNMDTNDFEGDTP